jgi:hypothetical protein
MPRVNLWLNTQTPGRESGYRPRFSESIKGKSLKILVPAAGVEPATFRSGANTLLEDLV